MPRLQSLHGAHAVCLYVPCCVCQKSACLYSFSLRLYTICQGDLLHFCHENCRMEQKTPYSHLPLHWMMPLTLQLFLVRPCLAAASQKMKKTALLPMASICPMARLPPTVTASDASMSAVQLPARMPALAQDVQSTNSQMTASGALCLPPSLLSIVCCGIVEGEESKHQQRSSPSADKTSRSAGMNQTLSQVSTRADPLLCPCTGHCCAGNNVWHHVVSLG